MARFILNITTRLMMVIIIVAIGLAMYPNKAYAAVSITALGTANNAAGTSPWTAKTNLSLTANDYIFVAEAADSATSAISVKYDDVIKEDTGATSVSGYAIYSSYWNCQSWTTTSAYSIVGIKLRLFATGSPSGNLNVDIYTSDANDKPTGSKLTSGSILASTVTSVNYYTIPLTSYALSNSTKYVAVVSVPNGDGDNNIAWQATSSAYGAGVCSLSTNSGSSWTNQSSDEGLQTLSLNAVSLDLTADVTATNSGNVVSKIWSGKVTVTGTAYYIVITNTSSAKAMAAYKASGITGTSAKDQTNSATGTGTGRAVSTSGNPTNAGDLAIVVCGIEQHSDDGAGTWENDTANDAHANAQFNGTTGGGSAANICVDAVADLTDNNSSVEHGHNTGPTNADYAIAIATYKMDAGYTISNTPSSKDYGIVATSTTYWSKGSAPSNPVADGECFFTVSNDGAAAFKVQAHAHNFTGGVGWTLGAPGSNQARLTLVYSGQDPATGLVLTTSDQDWIASLGASSHKHYEVKLESPTSVTDGVQKSTTITLTAIAP